MKVNNKTIRVIENDTDGITEVMVMDDRNNVIQTITDPQDIVSLMHNHYWLFE